MMKTFDPDEYEKYFNERVMNDDDLQGLSVKELKAVTRIAVWQAEDSHLKFEWDEEKIKELIKRQEQEKLNSSYRAKEEFVIKLGKNTTIEGEFFSDQTQSIAKKLEKAFEGTE